MAFAEDLSIFLADFGKPISAGDQSGLGIFSMPGEVLPDGMSISNDYTVTALREEFGNLLFGSAITVNGVFFKVLQNLPLDDGAFCQITLEKVFTDSGLVTDAVIDGGGASSVYPDGTSPDEIIYDGGGA